MPYQIKPTYELEIDDRCFKQLMIGFVNLEEKVKVFKDQCPECRRIGDSSKLSHKTIQMIRTTYPL